jgi:hypothetical protein
VQSSFPDADHEPRYHELTISFRKTAAHGGHRPEHYAGENCYPARKAVREPAQGHAASAIDNYERETLE